ncbi:hypothetical protein DLM76_19290 [Leptospira yasudae]|uniref:Uncharacterized protein n=1 Tax=Leptospira yasudae TaxID=2202201 RepID=A0ABX9LZG5_9LEPT|nr:hypothetical protein [Leptospira yasudae]MBW0435158.1 hypothetical protein [Leptospira yasudae]RHX78006.1 hypothetical protein DLM77_18190 [Leptospira yasudae]RHX90986.1 hypothetical protein DLM76_19290 [Leptospira yasudae]TGK26317.1 hypothetical protein EHQ05_11200 [Leptospira yasudae]TGM08438.1 hypothetical protein EHQ86_02355 [Leptospira yasudae]
MTQELDLERRCNELVGSKIETVRYYGQFQNFESAHGISESVYLFCDQNRIFRFGYEDEFFLKWGFGISVKKTPRILSKDEEEESLEATSLWREKQKTEELRIERVKLHWRYISDSRFVLWHSYNRSDYPQDVELILSNGNSVYVGVTKLLSDGQCKLFTNHLSVFWDAQERERTYEKVQRH